MSVSVLLGGTLCDARLFDGMRSGLVASTTLDYRAFDRAEAAASALIADVPAGSVVVAFSLGGWVALEMLKRWPDRFAGIVLLSGNAHPDDPSLAEARRRRVADGARMGLCALIDAEFDELVGARARSDPAIRTTLISMASACGHDVHGRQAELNIHRPDHRSLVAASPVPLLVVAGADDRLCPHDRYAAAAAGPRSRLVTVEGAGHFLPLEAPQATLRAIRAIFPEICR